MEKTVGIPRGLFFYEYYPFWKTFLEELGVKIIVSDNTSRRILDDGCKICVDEACLPVKVFHGHVQNLIGKVEYILIPRFTSISKNEYICPKIGGLPDMVRHTFKVTPTIIDTEINLRKSKSNEYEAVRQIGMIFSDEGRLIQHAYKKAKKALNEYKAHLKNGLLPDEILGNKKTLQKTSGKETLKIAIIGHAYNIFDSYVNMEMLAKLKSRNINVLTIDMIDEDIINHKNTCLHKKMFWNFGRRALGSTLHLLDREDIDGVIYIMSFGCGVDSFICDMVERRVRQGSSIPFIVLTIDEHSGEAGLDTRLEAFIDMIRWRKANESNIPAYG